MSSSTEDATSKPPALDKKTALGVNMADEWSARAEAYSVNFMEHSGGSVPHLDMQDGRKLIVSRVASFLEGKDNPVVLDVAAAGGEPALSMAKEMPHATVYGTDFASGMVDMIRKRCKEAGITNLKAQVEDGQALSGFADTTVDVVTCSWGLESMPDHQKAIEQFHRVLKPGGMALIAAWDKDPNSIALKTVRVITTLRNLPSDPVDDTPSDMQALGGDEGLKAMEKAGFINVKTSQVAIPLFVPPHVGLRGLFSFMTNPTPINGILSAMEKSGRPNVREEACAMFESQMLEDIAQGREPAGPGLGAGKEGGGGGGDSYDRTPAFYMKAVIVEGHRKGGL